MYLFVHKNFVILKLFALIIYEIDDSSNERTFKLTQDTEDATSKDIVQVPPPTASPAPSVPPSSSVPPPPSPTPPLCPSVVPLQQQLFLLIILLIIGLAPYWEARHHSYRNRQGVYRPWRRLHGAG